MSGGPRLALTSPPADVSGVTVAHDLVGAYHTESGLVTGQQLRATGATSAAFQYGSGRIFNVKDYGAVGDGVTDDTVAIQAALDAAKAAASGNSVPTTYCPPATYIISSPLYLPTLTRLAGPALIKAAASFSLPLKTGKQTEAMIHTINGTNIASTARAYMYDINITPNNVMATDASAASVPLNGICASLQQQAQWFAVRVNTSLGYGLKIQGQQCVFHNTEILTCDRGLVMGWVEQAASPGASFMWFYGLNVEKCTTCGIDFIGGSSSGSKNNVFNGVHFEFIDATTTSASCVRCIGQNCDANTFDNVSISAYGTAGTSQVGFDFGTSTLPTSYVLENVRWPNAGTGAGWADVIAVRDNYVGRTIKVWDDASGASASRQINRLAMPGIPTSDAFTGEYGGWTQWGRHGREVRIPGGRTPNPSIISKPATDQTGDQLQFFALDQTTKKTYVDKGGLLTLPTKAGAMTTSDLVTDGQVGVDTTGHILEFRAGGSIRHLDPAAGGSTPVMDVTLIGAPGSAGNIVYTNMAAGLNPIFNVDNNRVRADLSSFTQCRFSFYLGALGATGAKIFLQYSTDQTTWVEIDGSTGTEIAIDASGAQMKASGWVNLDTNAKGDVYLRIAGSGGDGAADPSFGAAHAEFK